mgnify:FL=1
MGHYYQRNGQPAHFEGPAGSATTLREARKLGLVPSVTEVLQVIAKPQLERWKREQAILSALTLPRLPDEPSASLMARIDADASRQAQEAASEGSAIHDAIEASYAAKAFPSRFMPHVGAVRAKLLEIFPKVTDWVSEQSFAHPDGFGGRVDLHSPSTGIVVDFKGKDGDFSDGKRLAYEQHYQLGAYQYGLGLGPSPGANIFVSRTHPGCVCAYIWEAPQMHAGWRVFEAALRLHKALKNYDGSWT